MYYISSRRFACYHRLLDIMEAQYGRSTETVTTDKGGDDDASDESDEETNVVDDIFDKNMNLKKFCPVLLRICASSRQKEDVSRAMTIAFDTYNKMVQYGQKPSVHTFEMLYTCVINYLEHYPNEDKSALLERVYNPAKEYGISRGELVGRHKQSKLTLS
jgi:hypothetical protein